MNHLRFGRGNGRLAHSGEHSEGQVKNLLIAGILIESPQELRVGVASVNPDMTRSAVPISRVSHVV